MNGTSMNGTSGKTDIEIATGSVLLFAQRVADDTIADARREAERILDEAPRRRAARARTGRPGGHRGSPRPHRAAARREPPAESLDERPRRMRRRAERPGRTRDRRSDGHARARARPRRRRLLRHQRPGAPGGAAERKPTVTDAPGAAPSRRSAEPIDDADLASANDPFVVDLRDALDDDRKASASDEFDELFASRGVFMESRETRRSRWSRSSGLFSSVLGNRAE